MKPKEDRTPNICLTPQHNQSSENQGQRTHSEKNGILPGVLKNNSNESRPLFRHHGRQKEPAAQYFLNAEEKNKKKNRLSTQTPIFNKIYVELKGKIKRFRDERKLKKSVNNRHSLKE